MPVMGVCLWHVETILRNQFFLIDFSFICSEEPCVQIDLSVAATL